MTLPPPITLQSSRGNANVYVHGAHVTAWLPDGDEPVLWLSSKALFEPGKAIRGGVPIVFPWFGAGRSGDLTPAHGFARTRSWSLVDSGTMDGAAYATFGLDGPIDGETTFPNRFSAQYRVRVGETLELSLDIRNLDEQAFSFEEALHAYLRVGDIRRVTIEGLQGCTYLDQVTSTPDVVQSGDVVFVGETDRIYRCSGTARIVDPVLRRAIVIEKEHSADTVIWNPWIDKAQRMEDFGDDEWLSMVCVEGGNLRESAVVLEPGQGHEMRYTVRVEPLG